MWLFPNSLKNPFMEKFVINFFLHAYILYLSQQKLERLSQISTKIS